MNGAVSTLVAAVAVAGCMAAGTARASSSDEAAIRALAAQFSKAFVAKDIDAIMKVYVQDDSLVVFDVVPPRQYVGPKAYRKDWEAFSARSRGR